MYVYKPFRFFLVVFAATWAFWITAAVLGRISGLEYASTALMLLGLLVPATVALVMVLTSKNAALKQDLKAKLVSGSRIRVSVVLISIAVFIIVIAVSIVASTLFGQSWSQFSLVEGFSFSIGGVPTLLVLVLTAFLEELGWRGYGQDALASTMTWFRAACIFAILWSVWHLPLFFIPDTYQQGLLQESPWFMVNFLVSIVPLGFLFAWVYAKSNRSILACMFFHFTVNFLQEQIAMTQITKCVETVVLLVVVGIVVACDKKLFFSRDHIGNLLGEPLPR